MTNLTPPRDAVDAHTQLNLLPEQRTWIEIPPYSPTRYHQRHGIQIHSDYCIVSETERVVRKQTDGGYRYSIQHICNWEGWYTLSPFSQFINSEEDAFAIAEWRKRRQEDPSFDAPAPWKQVPS